MTILLAAALGLGLYRFMSFFGGSRAAVRSAGSTARPKTAGAAVGQDGAEDPRLRLDILEASRKVKYEPGRDIFHMQAAPPPKVMGSVRTGPILPPGPPTPTPIPPIPLKYYGFASRPDQPKRVFLSDEKGERIFTAAQGDIVDRRYRLVQIQPNSVLMEDVFTSNRQPIQLTQR